MTEQSSSSSPGQGSGKGPPRVRAILPHSARFRPRRLASRITLSASILSHGVDRLKARLRQTRLVGSAPVRLVTRVIVELGDDDATHMAASVSYYAVLSLFPLTMGMIAVIGLVADSPERQEQVIEFVADFLPGSEEFVRDSVEGVVRLRGVLGIGSIFGLMWAASAVFGSITRAVNRAWDIRENPPFYKNKPRQLIMAVGVAGLFGLSVAVTSFLQWATTIEISDRTLSEILGGGVVTVVFKLPAFFISLCIFLAIYKLIPNTKTYWRFIWVGAVVAAVLFEGGKNIFLWYLENFASYDQLYGNITSVIILMVWTYFSAFILIFGAELASEYGRMKMGLKRGQLIQVPPDSD